MRTRRYAGEDATDEENNEKLLRELDGRRPSAGRRATGACWRSSIRATRRPPASQPGGDARARFEGRIAAGRGAGGFGYDPIFEPATEPPGGRTVGQISAEEKNRVSHRALAARAMARYLRTRRDPA